MLWYCGYWGMKYCCVKSWKWWYWNGGWEIDGSRVYGCAVCKVEGKIVAFGREYCKDSGECICVGNLTVWYWGLGVMIWILKVWAGW